MELDIFNISYDKPFREHNRKITLTQVGNSVRDTELIDKMEATSRHNYWHVESECGFEGELMGRDIKVLLKNYTGREPKNVKLILENVEADNFYRISVGY